MQTLFTILALTPALYLLVPLVARTPGDQLPRQVMGAARGASFLVALAAAVAAAAAFTYTPDAIPVLGPFSLRLDPLSMILLLVVSIVGLVVLEYSRTYLAGDPRHGEFLVRMSVALCAVSFLVLAGDLVLLAAAWMCTSIALQRLLVFYGNRPRAQLANKKKGVVARLADVFMVSAVCLLTWSFGTSNIEAILESARTLTAETVGTPVVVASALLALAAILKSAQFPFHVWLPEVIETPTPVSALLHAGLINAGGFLVIRLSDVVALSPLALAILAAVGGFTALYGSVVMLTQPSVKGALAYSTIAQMGFMLFECGIGAFSLAVLHIAAHSFYKAHAFLSAGGAVQSLRYAKRPTPVSAVHILAGFTAGTAALFGIYALFGLNIEESPQTLAMGTIFVMGTTLWLSRGIAATLSPRPLLGLGLGVAAATLAYFIAKSAANLVMGDTIAAAPPLGALGASIVLAVIGAFGALIVLQAAGRGRTESMWRSVYVHARNGFYINAVFNRLIGLNRSRNSVN